MSFFHFGLSPAGGRLAFFRAITSPMRMPCVMPIIIPCMYWVICYCLVICRLYVSVKCVLSAPVDKLSPTIRITCCSFAGMAVSGWAVPELTVSRMWQ